MDTIGWLIHTLEAAAPADELEGRDRRRQRPVREGEPGESRRARLLDRFWTGCPAR